MTGKIGCVCALLAIIGTGCTGPSVSTGKKVGDDTVVTIDNPDFLQSGVDLPPSQTKWNGPMAREIDTNPNGVLVSNGDFVVRTSQGDGPAKWRHVAYTYYCQRI